MPTIVENQGVRDASLFLSIILCFSLFASAMIIPLVEDRTVKFKHQLMLTKLHVVTYWISVLIWNALFYTFFCVVLLLFLFYFELMHENILMYVINNFKLYYLN